MLLPAGSKTLHLHFTSRPLPHTAQRTVNNHVGVAIGSRVGNPKKFNNSETLSLLICEVLDNKMQMQTLPSLSLHFSDFPFYPKPETCSLLLFFFSPSSSYFRAPLSGKLKQRKTLCLSVFVNAN